MTGEARSAIIWTVEQINQNEREENERENYVRLKKTKDLILKKQKIKGE